MTDGGAYLLFAAFRLTLSAANIVFVPLYLVLCLGVVGGGNERLMRRAAGLSVALTVAVAANYVAKEVGGHIHAWWKVWLSLDVLILAALAVIGLVDATGRAVSRRREGWTVFRPPAVYGVALTSLWMLSQVVSMFSVRSDGQMIAHFHRHQSAYEQLVRMFDEDRRTASVCPLQPDRADGSAALSPERRASYRALLAEIGAHHGITRDYRGQILIRSWMEFSSNWFDADIEQGYAYLTSPPQPLVETLARRTDRLAYRHVAGPWYLYYYDRDSIPAPCAK